MKREFWPKQESWSLLFVSFYSYVILSVSDVAAGRIVLYLIGQTAIFLVTVIAHEYGHYLAAMSAGVGAKISWLPQPTVVCGYMTGPQRRFIAIAGPIAGATVAISGITLLVAVFGLPVMIVAVAGSMAIVQLSMLVPVFADGKALFGK